ncbi:MAG: ion transporter [Ignavibacteriales bacterium]|nr:ion transporter [Ignavibacteriales bacterium]MCF8306137.1 ion transporter [Ignavibacteriales bacterium]MCF8315809.1 ion transporter [Ignavibacteriales bacterium]MCF8437269.1 ion transporter [Ignavibacteriales bacterium]
MRNKQKLYQIIFESDTKAGKNFDVLLLWCILFSILVAVLDSVPQLNLYFKNEFYIVEWFFTIIFSIEYFLRIFISPKPFRYIFSFWGFIDLLAILPTYLSLVIYGYHYLLVVRIFRLLRVFRILKLVRFNKEAIVLISALKESSYKIGIFFSAVLTIVVLLGTIMYVVENGENGFTSIPQSIYWAIITVTTVGYGDIVPHTVLGKFISSFAMIIGYAIIAVPTGIISVELSKKSEIKVICPACDFRNTETSNYCSHCGAILKKKEL